MRELCACFEQTRKALGILHGARWPVLHRAFVHGIALPAVQASETFDADGSRTAGVHAIRDECAGAHCPRFLQNQKGAGRCAVNPAPSLARFLSGGCGPEAPCGCALVGGSSAGPCRTQTNPGAFPAMNVSDGATRVA
jgi:hypothetical protein